MVICLKGWSKFQSDEEGCAHLILQKSAKIHMVPLPHPKNNHSRKPSNDKSLRTVANNSNFHVTE